MIKVLYVHKRNHLSDVDEIVLMGLGVVGVKFWPSHSL